MFGRKKEGGRNGIFATVDHMNTRSIDNNWNQYLFPWLLLNDQINAHTEVSVTKLLPHRFG